MPPPAGGRSAPVARALAAQPCAAARRVTQHAALFAADQAHKRTAQLRWRAGSFPTWHFSPPALLHPWSLQLRLTPQSLAIGMRAVGNTLIPTAPLPPISFRCFPAQTTMSGPAEYIARRPLPCPSPIATRIGTACVSIQALPALALPRPFPARHATWAMKTLGRSQLIAPRRTRAPM